MSRILDGLSLRYPVAIQDLAQRCSLHELGDRKGDANVGTEVVDSQDVRVRESRDRFGLPLEARQ